VTEDEERKVPPVELIDAVDRAVMAGLRLRVLVDDRPRVKPRVNASCRACGAALTVPALPWWPVATSRRLDDFALAHRDHVGREGGAR
jgi:hypothetical protein